MLRRVLMMTDRSGIARGGVDQGWSLRRIAEQIGRDVSVVSREIARNRRSCGYQPVSADVAAQRRRARPQTRTIDACPVLGARVLADVARSRTPRQITGRLRTEAADEMLGPSKATGAVVSDEAIYTWIYAMPRKTLREHGIMLRSKHTRHQPRRCPGQCKHPDRRHDQHR